MSRSTEITTRSDAPVDRRRAAATGMLVALAAAAFCFFTTENLPVGLLPQIAADLHASLPAVGLLVTGYGATVALLLPTSHPAENHAASGATPDARRYAALVATSTIVITGVFTTYTYVTPFLTEVSRFSPHSVGPLLAVGRPRVSRSRP